jgi:hypothetical protein
MKLQVNYVQTSLVKAIYARVEYQQHLICGDCVQFSRIRDLFLEKRVKLREKLDTDLWLEKKNEDEQAKHGQAETEKIDGEAGI